MKLGFYPNLARSGMRSNRRLYLPYLLACTGMVLLQYLMCSLSDARWVAQLPAGAAVVSILRFGKVIITLFAVIFLFYTSSFLARRRKKEFGLYNVLGMGKRHIARILAWETLFTALISVAAGIAGGMLVSKLAEVLLARIVGGSADYAFSFSLSGVIYTAVLFAVIFALIFLNTMRSVHAANPIALLHSEAVGEKPPRAQWLLCLIGLALLGGAYYMAVTIRSPSDAINLFFLAVLMVILATYLLFICGSVTLCRTLQHNKKYYYNPRHFVSLSSMVYRMKRNGAGLASICILVTMVLVTLSATGSLYLGSESALKARYPREINVSFSSQTPISDTQWAQLRGAVDSAANGAQTNAYAYRNANVTGSVNHGVVSFLESYTSSAKSFYFIPVSDYNRTTGANETLADGETLLYGKSSWPGDTLTLDSGRSYRIAARITLPIPNGHAAVTTMPSYFFVVPDDDPVLADESCAFGALMGFDLAANGGPADDAAREALCTRISDALAPYASTDYHAALRMELEDRASNRTDFFGLYGSLFFLGAMLSVAFLLGAVLIIYYKQVVEGYEDQSRFDIMQKVGMTPRDIRRSVNAQLLTVFFLPLLGAAVHLGFAFPLMRQLLIGFGLNDLPLFAAVTAGCFLLFALVYVAVYRATSNAYYHIVSGAQGSRKE